jgi:hypothetical protein
MGRLQLSGRTSQYLEISSWSLPPISFSIHYSQSSNPNFQTLRGGEEEEEEDYYDEGKEEAICNNRIESTFTWSTRY